MPTVCVQCTLKALVEGTPVPTFDESPGEHAMRVHPDPHATYVERQRLEAILYERDHPQAGEGRRFGPGGWESDGN